MTRSHEIEALRRLLLPADDGDPAAREVAWRMLRPSVGIEPIRPVARRRPLAAASRGRRLRRGVPLAFAAAVAASAGSFVLAGGNAFDSGGFGGLSAQTAAAAVLERAAQQLQDDRPLAPGQVRVVRVDMRQLVVQRDAAGRVHGFVLPRTWEERVDRDGQWSFGERPDGAPVFASAAARAAYEAAFGPYRAIAPKPAALGGPHTADEPDPGLLGLSANQVLTLPAEPAALRARLEALRSTQPADSPSDVATMAVRLLAMGPTPPAVRAGLAEVLAQLPEVHVVGEEIVGHRLGTTLELPGGDGWRTQTVIAADDGELLATRTVLTRPDPQVPGSRAGTVLDVRAYTTAITDSFAAPVDLDVPEVAGPVPPDAR